jgi:lipopolysaccharide biosynthesis glycosyltransferase
LGWPARQKRESWESALKAKDAESFSVEQDVFNSLYEGRLTWLPVEYNFVALWASHGSEIPENTKFLHFAGPLKPWFLEKHQAKACRFAGCPWASWFQMESSLTESPELQEVQTLIEELRIEGLNSFNSYTKSLRSFRLALLGRTKFIWIVLRFLFVFWGRTLGRKKLFDNSHPFHLMSSRHSSNLKSSH